MRAAVIDNGRVTVEDIDEPRPHTGEVLVRTLANGICGSDLHLLQAARAGSTIPGFSGPIVAGHEFCAEIVDYGPRTEPRVPVGTKVVCNPFTPRGSLVSPGGLGQYMVLDAARLLPVPEHVTAELAALTEPLAVGIRAVAVGESTPSRPPVVVIGLGPIGLSVVVALQAIGRGPIIGVDLAPTRLAIAERMGVDLVLDGTDDDALRHLGDFGFSPEPMLPLQPEGARKDLGITIYECSGADGMISKLMETSPTHTKIVVAGLSMVPDTIMAAHGFMKGLTIGFATAYSPDEFALSYRRIVDAIVDPSPMITATVPLGQAPWAFDALLDKEEVKIVVQPNA